MDFKNIKAQMITFLKKEAKRIGVKSVVVGISGGLDSAIVAVLCKEVFKDKMLGVLMPSHLSSDTSIEDAKKLCQKFDINYEIVEITPMVKGYFDNIKDPSPLRVGNFSARVRMSVLYDISARENSIVVGTSNRSEILLGYGTHYGDTACAINPLGQMYKSDEFEFAKFLGIIDEIIEKKPSADLWEGQSDEDELGYTYKTIDDMLKKMVDRKIPKDKLIVHNDDKKLIEMLEYRIKANAFKGQLPVIANIDF